MRKFTNIVSDIRYVANLLFFGLIGSMTVTGYALFVAQRAPENLTMHVPPDLTEGARLRVGAGEVPPSNVYHFAFYMWQQVNHWVSDGAKDYGDQIHANQFYITPDCQEQLKADMNRRHADGELNRRARRLMEIPGLGFKPQRVAILNRNSWVVNLDLMLNETQAGMPVKDTYIRYPMRVVRYDVNRDRNPWGLALDCFGDSRPARLDAQAVDVARQGNALVAVNPKTAQPGAASYVADDASSAPKAATSTVGPTTLPSSR